MIRIAPFVALVLVACGTSSAPEPPPYRAPVHTCSWADRCDEVADPAGLAGREIAGANCRGHEGIYTVDGCDPDWIGSTMPAGALPVWLVGADLTTAAATWSRFTPR